MANGNNTYGREIRAAVVRDKGGPFKIETLTLEEPRRDEVLVKIVAGGMCHTDMVARDKVYDVPHPIVLGHEGAEIVESVGAAVTEVAPGDPVVLSYMWCGHCKPCYLGKPFHCANAYPLCFGGARLDGSTATRDADGNQVHDHFFGQSSFGTSALANERNVVKVPKEAPLEMLGPLGCGIQTGAGAVINDWNMPDGSVIPPTDKKMEIEMVTTVARVQNGQLVEETLYFDNLSVMKQLGLA